MVCANMAEAVESFDAYVGERGGELLAVAQLTRWADAADQQQGPATRGPFPMRRKAIGVPSRDTTCSSVWAT